MFRRITGRRTKKRNPRQDVRTESKTCNCSFWMTRLFGCVVDKASAPQKKDNAESSPKRDFFCCLKCWRRGNKVAPTPLKETDQPKPKQKNCCTCKPKPKKKKLPLARIGNLQAIIDARFSPEGNDDRLSLLSNFKLIVASKAPEFQGLEQKDAHEFLISVMDQIQSLAPSLQGCASNLGTTYTCPVEEQMIFKMEKTRTCRRCSIVSSREEFFTNLSLDLFPGWSIENLLNYYLKETELEYSCECGGTISSLAETFASLPGILILHLKRFRFTSKYMLEKVNHKVHLQRDITVSTNKEAGCYSLVSIISHLGESSESGHYICDGLHPHDNPQELTDNWLTYNDTRVCESTGAKICKNREKSAYILFYQRNM